jgi:DNA-directed RNA polymerase subunit K/omega
MPKRTNKKSSDKKDVGKKKRDRDEDRNSEEDYAPSSASEYESASEIDSSESSYESSNSQDESDDSQEEEEDSAVQSGGESDEAFDEESEESEEESGEEDEDDDEEVDEEEDGEVGEEECDEDDGEKECNAGESKACYLKNIDKEVITVDSDDSNMYGKMPYKRINDEDRISDPFMTYYEFVKAIGTRARQFEFRSPPLVKNIDHLPPVKMAYVELMTRLTPFIIRRYLPGKKYEEWRIDELEIIHEISDDFFVPEKMDWNALMKQAANLNKKMK